MYRKNLVRCYGMLWSVCQIGLFVKLENPTDKLLVLSTCQLRPWLLITIAITVRRKQCSGILPPPCARCRRRMERRSRSALTTHRGREAPSLSTSAYAEVLFPSSLGLAR
uniref:Uncharacterized protein n=1 Tax=Trichuris muris TaxID=70415 RepID=A0A5S6Q1X9_TRIMR